MAVAGEASIISHNNVREVKAETWKHRVAFVPPSSTPRSCLCCPMLMPFHHGVVHFKRHFLSNDNNCLITSSGAMDHTVLESEQNGRGRKRKQLGRSSRRRKAKLRDIQLAEERMWNGGEAPQASQTTCVPTDRDKVWPGVLQRRGQDGLTEVDEAALVGQLGYLPGNAICVAARSKEVPLLPDDDEVPLVLKLYPLAIREAFAGGKAGGRKFKARRRGKPDQTKEEANQSEAVNVETPLLEPFPTHYWLTHPTLRTLTSKLELMELPAMEKRLQSDPKALESMQRAHKAYGQERWECLTENDLKMVKERKWEPSLDARRGVAGITRHTAIKCLHTHLAHHLSGGKGSEENVVGKWVLESIIKTLQERKAACETSTDRQE